MLIKRTPQRWRRAVDRAPAQPSISPLSAERLKWVNERLQAVDGARRDIMQYKAWYGQTLQSSHEVLVQAVAALRVEEVQLVAEKRFLESLIRGADEK